MPACSIASPSKPGNAAASRAFAACAFGSATSIEMMGDGVSTEQILADFPDLEREDILASLQFAARRSDIVRLTS